MKEMDKETPVLYGRTKGRKELEIGAPWVEADRSRTKPKALPIVISSIWEILWPGVSPAKWGGWTAVVSALAFFVYKLFKDDDDF